MSFQDRRSEPRLDDAELATVTWQDGTQTCRQLGNVEDLSLTGAGMIVDYPVPSGTSVSIDYGEGTLQAIVRHCRPLEHGHFVGVEFVGSSRGFKFYTRRE